ncbi:MULTISPECIES: ArsR/SmtB family transcription factor [Streptomyces]|uniref:ArsR/SmtB family transcription factor n=1 Tax=Streptomyces TaxID=1883 RepID=UPI00163B7F8B|nr:MULTISPECIES: metalloregulator ArsR/SmtB family transcription factor [Streptomyces]MBC2875096.1 metalloregulator ArsR/SmtB family transcription factor [Streptomyces sp. TYQ1024]UBI41061.1 metalloregulator ArsR/SmtB family transcription factor [Streptomyces mobaraensis]UKW33546.1 metalloregulator ArsR/SmtB family transcription factor [Streptomyces sp. TYQ1024]
MDRVFKALADPTRRFVLDRLRENNGQTLGELCESVRMTRQSLTQHLGVLEAARLVRTVRKGREKLHYLDPVPLHEIQERWISAFDRPRLDALSTLKQKAESLMSTENEPRPEFVHTTYIAATPEKVWECLMDPTATAAYWHHHNVSDWQPGSSWAHRRLDESGIDDVIGTVVEIEAPRRLVLTWTGPDEERPHGPSRVTFDLKPYGETVQLTVAHVNLRDEQELRQISGGWNFVLSNLKTYAETGTTLSVPAWRP